MQHCESRRTTDSAACAWHASVSHWCWCCASLWRLRLWDLCSQPLPGSRRTALLSETIQIHSTLVFSTFVFTFVLLPFPSNPCSFLCVELMPPLSTLDRISFRFGCRDGGRTARCTSLGAARLRQSLCAVPARVQSLSAQTPLPPLWSGVL
jgi:hypothetical protein